MHNIHGTAVYCTGGKIEKGACMDISKRDADILIKAKLVEKVKTKADDDDAPAES